MAYLAGEGSRLSELAVDVSSYQAELDWDALKQAGVTIAFIRVGYRGYGSEGKLVADEMFQTHIEGAKAAGIKEIISCGWHIMRISRISHICILAGSIQELARSQESDRNWI